MLKYANLALLVLYPVAWFAPLMRAGLLPVFGLSEISVITGLQSTLDYCAGRFCPRSSSWASWRWRMSS
jgi:hypothetical protein